MSSCWGKFVDALPFYMNLVGLFVTCSRGCRASLGVQAMKGQFEDNITWATACIRRVRRDLKGLYSELVPGEDTLTFCNRLKKDIPGTEGHQYSVTGSVKR